jgi:AcrR family transcriptional regulator
MARPKASDARDTRREILDAALDLFAEQGFYGTSLRDIARAVGVREGTIYHYFESKELLFEALLLEGQQDGAAKLEELVENAEKLDLQEMLERSAIGMLERFALLRERKLFRILMSDGMRLAAQGRWNYWARMGEHREPLQKLMAKLIETTRLFSESPDMLALEFIAPLVLWRQLLALAPEHPFVTDYRNFARRHVELFLLGAQLVERPPRKSNVRSTRRTPRR